MKICFILGENPEFLGGITLYLKNLLRKIPKSYEVFWAYRGEKDRIFQKEGINFIEVDVPKIYLYKDIIFNRKIRNFLEKNYFDVINPHAIWGHWIKIYKKRKNQKIVHTYHGSSYHYFKHQIKRFNPIKRSIFFPLLLFAYFIEKPPMKKADCVICVSDHVKREFTKLYGTRKDINIIRTGVDIFKFKPRDKKKIRKKLKLETSKIYGLYIARGGYWNKGLDRVTKLSKEIYGLNKNYRLLVIGSNPEKIKKLIDKRFMILFPLQSRKKLPYYYNAVDIFFNASRYEGGAPTLVTSEAMASKCLIVCSKDSNQEIIKDKKECLTFAGNYKKEAKRILAILGNKVKKDKIVENAFKKIKDLSLEKWSRKYLNKLEIAN